MIRIRPAVTAKIVAAAALASVSAMTVAADASSDGFTSLLSGNTLTGWQGDPDFFSVKDGVLSAGAEKDTPHNTYLILDKPHGDFELHYKYRWKTADGNSGIQFRSGIADGHFALAGMQANVTPITPAVERFGMLYEELGDRAEMALLGQKAEITRRAAGRGGRGRIVRTVSSTTNPREAILAAIKPYPEWNEGVLIAYGDRIIHVINGLVAFDATDKDPLTRRDGLIGIQVHSGSPMTVEYKDLEIRDLTSLPDLSGYVTHPGPAPEPHQTYKDSTVVGMADVALP
jgi:hypothetical protein